MSGIVINGRNVHLSGMTAAKREGRSVAEQTGDILKRIDELLADAPVLPCPTSRSRSRFSLRFHSLSAKRPIPADRRTNALS
jgi:hypothetical protein